MTKTIKEPNLDSIAQNVYPVGSDIMKANFIDKNTQIFSQDILKQQRENLVLSIENTFPNQMAHDFLDEPTVRAKVKNEVLNYMIGNEFKNQRRYLDLGNTNNYQEKFEPNIGESENRLAYSNENNVEYNRPDEWLS